MKLNIDPEWLLRMADKEANGIISVGGLIVAALSELTPHQRRRLFVDGVTPEQDRAAGMAELERIFGPGWRDDVKITIKDTETTETTETTQ